MDSSVPRITDWSINGLPCILCIYAYYSIPCTRYTLCITLQIIRCSSIDRHIHCNHCVRIWLFLEMWWNASNRQRDPKAVRPANKTLLGRKFLKQTPKKQRLLCSLFCGAAVARQVCRPRWRMARIVYRLDPSNRDQFDVVDSSGREGKQYKDSLLKSKVLCGEQCGNLKFRF